MLIACLFSQWTRPAELFAPAYQLAPAGAADMAAELLVTATKSIAWQVKPEMYTPPVAAAAEAAPTISHPLNLERVLSHHFRQLNHYIRVFNQEQHVLSAVTKDIDAGRDG